MALTQLSKGAVHELTSGVKPDSPILQVIAIKEIKNDGKLRHRLLLSDGELSFGTTMLATQLNPLVTNGELSDNSIIKMDKYQCTTVHGNKLVVICIGCEILHPGNEVGQKIGNPIPHKQATAAAPRNNQQNNIQLNRQPASMQSNDSPKPTGKMPFKKNGLPTTPGGSQQRVVPIIGLTPYQNRWTIRARVVKRADVKEWTNAKGSGKLFSFTVTDDSCDIRITAFNDEVDKFFNLVEANKVVYISNGTLKQANQAYNNTQHDYEMTLRRESQVILCDDAESQMVPEIKYNFVPIRDLSQKVGSYADVIGIVKDVEELQTIMIQKQNRETSIRKFQLVDQTNTSVRVTLWGKEAENFDGEGNPVLAIRGAKVSDYGGCTLGTTNQSTLTLNPDIKESHQLKQWFATGGSSQATQSLSSDKGSGNSSQNWKILSQISDERLGFGEKPDYITSKVTVLYVKKENSLYQACPTEQCNKKVVDLSNGQFRCEKCNSVTDNFKYRMILNVNIADEYDNQWVTCFQEQGEIMLGITSQELGELKVSDENAYESALRKMYFKSYFMKMRVKNDRFNDEDRTRVNVVNLSPVNFTDYNKKLLSDLRQLL